MEGREGLNLQIDQGAGSFEGVVLNRRDLVASQVHFDQVGQITEHAVRFDAVDLVIVQQPIHAQITIQFSCQHKETAHIKPDASSAEIPPQKGIRQFFFINTTAS